MTVSRGRMRRVDEAVREVIADAIAGGVLIHWLFNALSRAWLGPWHTSESTHTHSA